MKPKVSFLREVKSRDETEGFILRDAGTGLSIQFSFRQGFHNFGIAVVKETADLFLIVKFKIHVN
jgi:hypothetical protein